MTTLAISIFAVLLSLIFGISGFLNNILGKSPAIEPIRSVFPLSPADTHLVLKNYGVGPAIVTKITVRYRDTTFGIDKSVTASHPGWFQDLLAAVNGAYADGGHAPMHDSTVPNYHHFWAKKDTIIGVGNEMPLLRGDLALAARHKELCLIMSYLETEIEYQSFYGIRFTTLKPYNPLGNVDNPSWLFLIYTALAKLFGLTRMR